MQDFHVFLTTLLESRKSIEQDLILSNKKSNAPNGDRDQDEEGIVRRGGKGEEGIVKRKRRM